VVATGEHNFPNNPTGQILDITYDGVSLTNAVDRDPIDGLNATAADIWYLDDPGSVHVSGALDATVTGNGNNYVYTVLALSNTMPGVGATAISVMNSKSVALDGLGPDSLVLASHGMGGDGNTADVLSVDAVAPATELSDLEAGNNWAGHVTSYTNGVVAGNATYSFTGGSTTGVVTIAAEFMSSQGPGTPYCFGRTDQGNACPCGNDNDGTDPLGAGCAHDDSPAGATLVASGVPSISADTLLLRGSRGPISNTSLFFQANNSLDGAGIFLGDGIRCAGGGLIRLEVKMTDAAGYADSSSMVVTTRSASFGHAISAGDTLYYQWWIHDAGGSPCGTESNTSNGYAITWLP